MSKILQNIANHVEFSKEQHMLPFNDFLRQHFEGARRFFIQIASDCESVEQTSHSISFISDANVHALHRLLWNHQEKIGVLEIRSLVCVLQDQPVLLEAIVWWGNRFLYKERNRYRCVYI